MRIQHNITAMNSYRNYFNNNSGLSKNLEKLSSGYSINRAGDDAAGLAISEKMRAQITGLEVAQKNAKDGISLVQTAEGALTEIHTMLNRMYSLAEQSANGTYDETVDRAQLQKEVDSLKEEINRIADSANFNGIALLDGSMSGGASSAVSSLIKVNAACDVQASIISSPPQTQKMQAAFDTGIDGLHNGSTLNFTIELDDGSNYSLNLTVSKTTNGVGAELILSDGTPLASGTLALASYTKVTKSELGQITLYAAQKFEGLKEKFDIKSTDAANVVNFNAYNASFDTPTLKNVTISGAGNNISARTLVTTQGLGMHSRLDFSKLKIYKYGQTDITLTECTFSINGKRFAFVQDDASLEKLPADVVGVRAAAAAFDTATDKFDDYDSASVKSAVQSMINHINQVTGLNMSVWKSSGASDATLDYQHLRLLSQKDGGGTSGGLTLQIGDTADNFNKMTVSIDNMHTTSMGIAHIDISTQGGAATAMASIKSAINYVSNTRGTLGATQNRLDHTINNLSVMQENIQDAEGSIRDVDVAEEMMEYTKNSILVQSAQAMLAQANQLPQGVLQLLG